MRRAVFNLGAMSRVLRSAVTSRLAPAMSPATRFEFDLLKLPEELICLVIEHVHQIESLERLSRTCRQLQRLAEPKLYRHHTLRSGYDGNMLLYPLDMQPARESYIHQLAYLMTSESGRGFECMQDLLTRSTNLKEFSFESPECNSSDFEDEETWTMMTDHLFQAFEDATDPSHSTLQLSTKPLQMLNKLTLHMNGIESPYWNFDVRSKTIFLLPALSQLKISCVNVLDDLADGIDRVSFSPLKHLEFEECNFTHTGLKHVLSFPKALKSLELLENCHNVMHFPDALHPTWNQLFETNPAATLEALSQQKDSLVSLTYATAENGYGWGRMTTNIIPSKTPVDGGFADFFALENIKLVGDCPKFERAVLSSRAPPNLKVLAADTGNPLQRFHYNFQPTEEASQNPLDFAPFFRAPSSCMPKALQKLELTHTALPAGDRELILNVAKKLGAAGAKLTVAVKFGSHRYFPPYLDGEERPVDEVYFDGEFLVARHGLATHALSPFDESWAD